MTNQTALVTGASSGIGLEIAKELARKRFDLVLVARREDKLQELAALLSPHVKVTVLPFDLSLPEAPQQLFHALQGTSIDLLINNAGFADYGLFVESDAQKMSDMLAVNIVALTKLTRLFLPPMIERKRGRIMNVASVAAYFPGPLMSVYYASKAYVLSFSEALINEVEGTGVTVTCLCPGATSSEFQGVAGMGDSKLIQNVTVTSKAVAQKGVRAMLRGDGVYVPGLNNQLVTLVPRLLPRGALAPFIRRLQEKI